MIQIPQLNYGNLNKSSKIQQSIVLPQKLNQAASFEAKF